MTDKQIYELLIKKSENIKMHMVPADVREIAERFKYLSDFHYIAVTKEIEEVLKHGE